MAGTHAKPRRTLRALAKGAALLAASCTVALAVTVPIGFAQHAQGAEMTAETTTMALVTKTPVNWVNRTCGALSAWERHQSTTNLTTLVTDATHLGRSYLKADVGQLFADASSPSTKSAEYVSVSDQYAAEDCWGGA